MQLIYLVIRSGNGYFALGKVGIKVICTGNDICVQQPYSLDLLDSVVREMDRTNIGSFSPTILYHRKMYYSDDELSLGDNSDINDEDSFPLVSLVMSAPQVSSHLQ